MNVWNTRRSKCHDPEDPEETKQQKKPPKSGRGAAGAGKGGAEGEADSADAPSSMRRVNPSRQAHAQDVELFGSGNNTITGKKTKAVCNWVQCEKRSCKKWRRLPPHINPETLPEKWSCQMNFWDSFHNACVIPEEVEKEDGEGRGGGGAGGLPAHLLESKGKGAGKLSYREIIFHVDGKLKPPFSEKSTITSVFAVGENVRYDAGRQTDLEAYSLSPAFSYIPTNGPSTLDLVEKGRLPFNLASSIARSKASKRAQRVHRLSTVAAVAREKAEFAPPEHPPRPDDPSSIATEAAIKADAEPIESTSEASAAELTLTTVGPLGSRLAKRHFLAATQWLVVAPGGGDPAAKDADADADATGDGNGARQNGPPPPKIIAMYPSSKETSAAASGLSARQWQERLLVAAALDTSAEARGAWGAGLTVDEICVAAQGALRWKTGAFSTPASASVAALPPPPPPALAAGHHPASKKANGHMSHSSGDDPHVETLAETGIRSSLSVAIVQKELDRLEAAGIIETLITVVEAPAHALSMEELIVAEAYAKKARKKATPKKPKPYMKKKGKKKGSDSDEESDSDSEDEEEEEEASEEEEMTKEEKEEENEEEEAMELEMKAEEEQATKATNATSATSAASAASATNATNVTSANAAAAVTGAFKIGSTDPTQLAENKRFEAFVNEGQATMARAPAAKGEAGEAKSVVASNGGDAEAGAAAEAEAEAEADEAGDKKRREGEKEAEDEEAAEKRPPKKFHKKHHRKHDKAAAKEVGEASNFKYLKLET